MKWRRGCGVMSMGDSEPMHLGDHCAGMVWGACKAENGVEMQKLKCKIDFYVIPELLWMVY